MTSRPRSTNYCHKKQTNLRNNSKKFLLITMRLYLSALLLLGLAFFTNKTQQQQQQQQQVTSQKVFAHDEAERTSDYWLKSGKTAIDEALRNEPIKARAKNVILFIGDGMSLSTITAARILHGQLQNKSGEEGKLSFELLPNVALLKTYNVDQQIPDSAATATALLCGVKSNFYTLGVNGQVKLNSTNCEHTSQNKVHSIIKHAIDAGKSTGIVTNTRITHATPAAAYAHSANRRWECAVPKTSLLPNDSPNNFETTNVDQCKDIARQLIEDEPGRRVNVILGGGRRCFFGPKSIDPGPTHHVGLRTDNRNLIDTWIEQRRNENSTNFAFVNSTSNLRSLNIDETDYLLGLFSYSHMSYEELRDTSPFGEPSLAEMTTTAIKILSKNQNGFVLVVESGRIDHSHHENVASVALRETVALSWTVEAAQKLVSPNDTLLAVTADHAQTNQVHPSSALTINGLAPRGNPILGLSFFRENTTKVPYTTLLYGTGPGHHTPRQDPTLQDVSADSPYYINYAAVHQEEAYHDGSDVGIFALGPFAHLFQGTQEQSYVAHVLSYASCIGEYAVSTFTGNLDYAPAHCLDDVSTQQTQLSTAKQQTKSRLGFLGFSSAASSLKVFESSSSLASLWLLTAIVSIATLLRNQHLFN